MTLHNNIKILLHKFQKDKKRPLKLRFSLNFKEVCFLIIPLFFIIPIIYNDLHRQ